MKHHKIEQNTEEWFKLRAGKLTMSNLGKVMANYGKAFGEPAKKYAVDIAIEQITGEPIPSAYQNEHMQRGHEQEPIARSLYESETFTTVFPGGFYCSEEIGYSPDGLIGETGLIEIKSVISHVHYATIKRQDIDPAYKWQCIGGLKYTGAEWLEFVSYCSDFPEGKQLFIHRSTPDQFAEEFKQVDERVSQFLELVKSTRETIENARYL
jgi:hypothetical protein